MTIMNTQATGLRAAREFRNEKGFWAVSAAVFDFLLTMMLLFFLLYRCTNWVGGNKEYWMDPASVQTLIDAGLWACIALEFFWSPGRAVAALALLLVRNYRNVSYPQTLLLESLLLTLLCNLGSKRNNRNAWMILHVIGFEFLFFLRMEGMVRSATAYEGKSFFSGAGQSFALVHPNSLAVVMMSVILLAWVWKKRKAWISIPAFLAAAAAILYVTQSRTVAIVTVAFPLFALGSELVEKKEKKHGGWKSAVLGILPFLGVGVSILLSLYILGHWRYGTFWVRFTDFSVLRENITLWGTRSAPANIWFDNLYYWLAYYCGMIPAILVLLGYGYMNIRLYRRKEYGLLAVSVLMLLFGFMENSIVYPFHFFVPLMAFARPDEEDNGRKGEGQLCRE